MHYIITSLFRSVQSWNAHALLKGPSHKIVWERDVKGLTKKLCWFSNFAEVHEILYRCYTSQREEYAIYMAYLLLSRKTIS